MGANEVRTIRDLATRRVLMDRLVGEFGGRIVNSVGDSVLAEFSSVSLAVEAAIQIQDSIATANDGVSPDEAMHFRVGLHLGEVILQEGHIFGDGVNIAARLQSLAPPGGIVISELVYDQVRRKTALSVRDMGIPPLKNIEGAIRAFEITKTRADAVAQTTINGASSTALQPSDEAPLALPEKPSIAVLPFQNMSGDPEQEYFADGMVEDIITALSRFKSLFVIARNSSLNYKGKAVDTKKVGRELGVRYVLEGGVRKAANKIRITGQLIECETGAHLWADRFDGSLEDVFELQDQIATSIVGAIAPKLDTAEMERAKRKPLENLDAYDWYLRGLAKVHVSNKEALRLFYRAIELDPDFATPYGMAARCYIYRRVLVRVVDEEAERAETRRVALRASALGQDDAVALTWAGLALVEVCREYQVGEALVDQALAINSNLAVGWTNRAMLSCYLGRHEAAVEQVSRALRLSPLDLETYRSEFVIAFAYLFQGNYAEAVRWARKSVAHRPGVSNAALMAALALAGDADEAREVGAELCRIAGASKISNLSKSVAWRGRDLDLLREAYRLAGIPE